MINVEKKLADHPFPTMKDEAWKYIDLQVLATHELSKDHATVHISDTDSVTVTTYTSVEDCPSELNISRFIDVNTEKNHFLWQALAATKTIVHLAIDGNASDDIVITIDAASGKMAQVLVFVTTTPDSRANILIRHKEASALFVHTVLLSDIADRADIDITTVQEHVSSSLRFDTFRAQLHKTSILAKTYISSGNALARIDCDATLNQPFATVDLRGLARLDESSKCYVRSFVRHLVGDCTSMQLFKHVLNGRSVSEYNGGVYVAPHALLTDSSQSNQNLLLSDQARALSRPKLEIYADDVKAGHGATVGQLDPAQLFYLQSRGLSEDEARDLLLEGFCCEVTDKIRSSYEG